MNKCVYEAIEETVPKSGPWIANQIAEKVYRKLRRRSDAADILRELALDRIAELARHHEHQRRAESAPFRRKNHRDDGLEEEVTERVSAFDLSLHTGEQYVPIRIARAADLLRDASIREKTGHTTLRVAAFYRKVAEYIGPDKTVGEAMTEDEYMALAEEMLGDDANRVLGDRDEEDDEQKVTA